MKKLNTIVIFLVCILMLCSSCTNRTANANAFSANATASESPSPLATTRNANTGLQVIDEGLEETGPEETYLEESEGSGDEGQREAEKFWTKYAPTCSGIMYMKSGRQGFMELNGFRITMEYESVTQADQLNGIEAKGMTRITSTTYRFFYDAKWHEWKNGSPSSNIGMVAHFQRYKGQWKFEGRGYFYDFAQTMNCSEVPVK